MYTRAYKKIRKYGKYLQVKALPIAHGGVRNRFSTLVHISVEIPYSIAELISQS